MSREDVIKQFDRSENCLRARLLLEARVHIVKVWSQNLKCKEPIWILVVNNKLSIIRLLSHYHSCALFYLSLSTDSTELTVVGGVSDSLVL